MGIASKARTRSEELSHELHHRLMRLYYRRFFGRRVPGAALLGKVVSHWETLNRRGDIPLDGGHLGPALSQRELGIPGRSPGAGPLQHPRGVPRATEARGSHPRYRLRRRRALPPLPRPRLFAVRRAGRLRERPSTCCLSSRMSGPVSSPPTPRPSSPARTSTPSSSTSHSTISTTRSRSSTVTCAYLKPDGLVLISLFELSPRARSVLSLLRDHLALVDETRVSQGAKSWICGVFAARG